MKVIPSMSRIVKAVIPKYDDDCGCGKPVKKTERRKIIYKKTIKRRK